MVRTTLAILEPPKTLQAVAEPLRRRDFERPVAAIDRRIDTLSGVTMRSANTAIGQDIGMH